MPHELSKGFNDEDSVVTFWENVDIKKVLGGYSNGCNRKP